MYLTGPEADDVIFSVTLSEGWLDEYKEFDLPEVYEPMTSEEFEKIAVQTVLGLNTNWFIYAQSCHHHSGTILK